MPGAARAPCRAPRRAARRCGFRRPVRSGSRISSCGPSGGGNAPSSGGAVSLAGASLATVTGRQSGVGRVRAVQQTPQARAHGVAAKRLCHDPGLGKQAPRGYRDKASCRGAIPSGARYGHCEDSLASGSHSRSRFRLSRLRSRFTWSGASTDGRVQAATLRSSRRPSAARGDGRVRRSHRPARARASRIAAASARPPPRPAVPLRPARARTPRAARGRDRQRRC